VKKGLKMAKESKLPRGLSWKRVVNALQRAGFFKRRQKGSHIIMQRRSPFAQVTVPAHKSIDTGTLANILCGADLSVGDFLNLL
jgi:predicted RNA binding protein YcfA (HicA-like mRNA interferase family)